MALFRIIKLKLRRVRFALGLAIFDELTTPVFIQATSGYSAWPSLRG